MRLVSALILCVLVSGCATNNQRENERLGRTIGQEVGRFAIGGLFGAPVIIGAMIGETAARNISQEKAKEKQPKEAQPKDKQATKDEGAK